MKLISIHPDLISCFSAIDSEVLTKDRRPAILVVRLKYRDLNRNFAVPLRSNIPPLAPSDEYFALPTRSTTKSRHHHGLHFIKMFPVDKRFYQIYRVDRSDEAKRILTYIDKHESEIIAACQQYLARYESGSKPRFSTDLDALLAELDRLCKG